MHDDNGNGADRLTRARLFELAPEQGQHFTAAHAACAALAKAVLAHHANSWPLRVRRGVYRFREYPSSPREDAVTS